MDIFQIEVGRECQPGHESIQVEEPLLSVDAPEKSRQVRKLQRPYISTNDRIGFTNTYT